MHRPLPFSLAVTASSAQELAGSASAHEPSFNYKKQMDAL